MERQPIIVDITPTVVELAEARLGLSGPTVDYVSAHLPDSTSTSIPEDQAPVIATKPVNPHAAILEQVFGKPKNRKQQRRLDHAHRVTLGMYKQELQAKETAKAKRRKKEKAAQKQKKRNRQ